MAAARLRTEERERLGHRAGVPHAQRASEKVRRLGQALVFDVPNHGFDRGHVVPQVGVAQVRAPMLPENRDLPERSRLIVERHHFGRLRGVVEERDEGRVIRGDVGTRDEVEQAFSRRFVV